MQGPLTLLAAPAGAGKSALLSSWVAAGRAPGPVAWLSLDGDDADRRRFWRGVLGTLSQATGDARLTALAVSPREPMDMDLVLPALVDALDARDEPVVLVLDDLHQVAEVVREDIERLVRYPPPALRLVLVTRADPPIGLGAAATRRLADRDPRARSGLHARRGRCVVRRARRAHRARRARDAVAAHRRLVGGAVPGRHVGPRPSRARRSSSSTSRAPTPRSSDYLLSEVLARQPPDLREFLLRTSIVDMVCGDLADALTGGSDGQRMLARLEHGGALLAPLDEHGAWHRYHPLFAELLRAELRAQLGGELEELHRRAAVWLAAHGDRTAALRHVAIGRVWDLGTQLVIDHWVDFMINGEMAALRPVLEAMPRERVDACPELSLAFGAAMLAFGEQELAEPHLRGAARSGGRRCRRSAGRSSPLRRPPWGSTRDASARDPAAALTAAREWLGRGPVLEGHGVAPNLRGLLLTQLGIVEMWTGELDAAVEHLERAHAVAAEDGVEWTAFASSAHLALASLLRGDFARALRRAHQALAIAERRGWAAIGARRPPPPACSQPSASSAISSTRPNASSARRARRCASTRERPLAGRPRPQSRAAVERPRRARRRTGPPARDARAARGLAAAGADRASS